MKFQFYAALKKIDEKESSDEQRRQRILKELAETNANKSNILVIVLWAGSINIKCSAQTKNKAKLFRNDNNHCWRSTNKSGAVFYCGNGQSEDFCDDGSVICILAVKLLFFK